MIPLKLFLLGCLALLIAWFLGDVRDSATRDGDTATAKVAGSIRSYCGLLWLVSWLVGALWWIIAL